jgi:hypothetical protein
MVMLSLTGRQFPFPVVVTVSVTVPAVFSEAEGVYTALAVVLLGTYDPAPPDQRIPPAPVYDALSVVAALLAQTDRLAPALMVGAGVKVIFI